MKKKRFTEIQILQVLKEYGGGIPAVELARKHGIGESTIYAWNAKYAGTEVRDLNSTSRNSNERMITRQKSAKKRSLHIINEHFRAASNTVSRLKNIFETVFRK